MTSSMTTYKRFFLVMGILCLAAIVLNLAVRRGPVNDANAVDDLRSIMSSIDGYYSNNLKLPADLGVMKSGLSSATRQRLKNYEYIPGVNSHYQLCATFSTAGGNGITTMPYPANPDPSQHSKGHQCFDYVVNNFNIGGPKPL